MVVVAIVAILAAVAGPSFRNMIAKQRVRSAASAISESVWLGRAEAMKRNAEVTFTFNAGGWEVTPSADDSIKLFKQDELSQVTATLKNGSSGVFTFNQYGRVSAAQTIELQSGSIASSTRCVAVSQTGKATITDGACS
jgi:Tfp pilus assembly protein FimT